jgi:hypothetical protein
VPEHRYATFMQRFAQFSVLQLGVLLPYANFRGLRTTQYCRERLLSSASLWYAFPVQLRHISAVVVSTAVPRA